MQKSFFVDVRLRSKYASIFFRAQCISAYFQLRERYVLNLLSSFMTEIPIPIFLTIENPLKMKNVFYFMLKARFVLEIFTFLFWLFGYVEKRLDKKTTVNFKFYVITDWKTLITIHILPNITGSKGNQVIKFDQLIKYSVRNIFLQKLSRKWGS